MINTRGYNYNPEVESLTLYRDGGLYPIHINDRFQDGRYQILNKLGQGSSSTVWVARDHYKDTDVSIKVIKAEDSENNLELRILQHIQKDTQHPGRKYLPQLLDYFCQGPSVVHINGFLPNQRYGLSSTPERYGRPLAPELSRQLLLAIDCLHSYGIVHGDIYEGNILFRFLDDIEIDFEGANESKVTRKDGGPLEKGIPRCLVTPVHYEDEVFHKLGHIQLIDFSSSFFESEPPEKHITALHVSPPELIFKKPLSKTADIWSFACIAYYFATGEHLFETHFMLDRRNLIPQIHCLIGESSADWLLTALLEETDDDDIWKRPKTRLYDPRILEEELYEMYTVQINASDAEKENLRVLGQFLRKALIVDPTKRATVKELQAEEWIQGNKDEGQQPNKGARNLNEPRDFGAGEDDSAIVT